MNVEDIVTVLGCAGLTLWFMFVGFMLLCASILLYRITFA
jgi:hypothetical protein